MKWKSLVRPLFSKNLLPLYCVFLLALFLRLYKLNSLPNGFYEEEVTNAYVGRFILHNGKDLFGHPWPILYFDKFGDYPPVFPMYLSGLATYIFGVTEFAARFPLALAGALTVFPLFFLSELMFQNKKLSLFCAFCLAILPWHVVLSRTSTEGIVGLAAYTLGLYLVIKGILEKNSRPIVWSGVWFFLTYFLYPSMRILVPLTLLPLPLLSLKDKPRKHILIGSLCFFVILTGMIASTIWGKGRFLQTSLFQSQEIREHVGMELAGLSFGDGQGNIFLARLFHNKVVGYTRAFFNQYFSYFSPKYLFTEGGGQYRYYNVPFQGLLYIVLAPLFLFVLLPKSSLKHDSLVYFIIYLLLVSPLPAAITVDFTPHVHRSIGMIIPLLLLATYGLYKFLFVIPWKKLCIIVFMMGLIIEGVYFWHQYANHSSSLQSILRNEGDKEMVEYVIKNKNKYDKVVMPMFARIPIYYMYFTKNFNKTLASEFKSELKIYAVDNIQFFGDWCPTKFLKREEFTNRSLVVENGDCEVRNGYAVIDQLYRSDSTKAYKFLIPQ